MKLGRNLIKTWLFGLKFGVIGYYWHANNKWNGTGWIRVYGLGMNLGRSWDIELGKIFIFNNV